MNWIYKFLMILPFCFLVKIISNVQAINKYDGISMQEAEILAGKAQKKTEFPIALNTQVLHYLDKFLSKPSGRLQLKSCLGNMKKYKNIILSKIKNMKLPEELMAIPIIESCYLNIHSKNGTGSGIWMLIGSTAMANGLQIDAAKDERLDIDRSTEAAMEYLNSSYKNLKHWHLAILAYNLGESKVRWAILESNSRDAWELTESGYERDKGYLAKIMAVIIIMKNVELLN